MPAKTHKFTILMEPKLYAALTAAAVQTGLSRGLLMRYSFTYYHVMLMQGVPTCATGQQCMCPQLHQRVGPQATAPIAAHQIQMPTPVPDPNMALPQYPQAPSISPEGAALPSSEGQ